MRILDPKALMLIAALCAPAAALSAEPGAGIAGTWVTYDDETGKKRSVITITEENGAVSGRITEVFAQSGDKGICEKCEGERHNQPIVGLEIFHGLTFDGTVWSGGTILDPKNGKEYKCELRLEGGELKVRGFLFVFFRTQTWKRA